MSRTEPGGIEPGELLSVAVEIAAAAAARLRQEVLRDDIVAETKSSVSDWVTEVDRAIESQIVAALQERRPDDAIVGEEGADHFGATGVRWLIDPIDGTTNFLHRLPGFAVSIAAELDGTVVAGAVADPLHNEMFAACRGRGATRNGEPIRVRLQPSLASALVATGFSYDPARRRRQADALTVVLPRIGDIRRLGAASTDLCAVAAGRVAAYYEHGLNPWDFGAGALIAAEAGAVVVGPGGSGPPSTGLVVAATPDIAEDLLALLADAGLL